MMKRRTLGLFAAAVLGLNHARGWAASELVVGQVASTGAGAALGGKVYFDYINATGGVHGQKIRQLVLDGGRSSGPTGVVALLAPDAVAVAGPASVAAPHLPAVREFSTLMKRHAPGEAVDDAGLAQFLGAKVLVEALRRAGRHPSRAQVLAALQSVQEFDLGGVTASYAPRAPAMA